MSGPKDPASLLGSQWGFPLRMDQNWPWDSQIVVTKVESKGKSKVSMETFHRSSYVILSPVSVHKMAKKSPKTLKDC